MTQRKTRRHWRFYRTAAGAAPAKAFIDELRPDQRAQIYQRMEVVRDEGLDAARHLRGDIYEVRVEANKGSFRVLFSSEGRFSQVLLAVHAIEKRSERTPPREIDLAERRLHEWRERGRKTPAKTH